MFRIDPVIYDIFSYYRNNEAKFRLKLKQCMPYIWNGKHYMFIGGFKRIISGNDIDEMYVFAEYDVKQSNITGLYMSNSFYKIRMTEQADKRIPENMTVSEYRGLDRLKKYYNDII